MVGPGSQKREIQKIGRQSFKEKTDRTRQEITAAFLEV
jgi:hypothetical protein